MEKYNKANKYNSCRFSKIYLTFVKIRYRLIRYYMKLFIMKLINIFTNCEETNIRVYDNNEEG